jgi:ABC-type transport system involved in cytochrome bd biosynthesis fused ATPase/permease subunit
MKRYTFKSLEDILERIDRLNNLIKIHKSQANTDILAIDGYQRLKFQYSNQIKEILHEFDIEVEIHGQAA